ncbi:Kinesin-like protein KIN-13B, partial [Dictyocoela roeselum]
ELSNMNRGETAKIKQNLKHENKIRKSCIRFSLSSHGLANVSKEIKNSDDHEKHMTTEKIGNAKGVNESLGNKKGVDVLKNGDINRKNYGDNNEVNVESDDFKVSPSNDAKSTIKVVIRKKPVKGREDVVKIKDNSVTLVENKLKKDLDPFVERHTFTFDQIFSEKDGNEEIFEKCMVEVLDNFNADISGTVICYGQTGTGKTYTLFKHNGLLIQSLNVLFGNKNMFKVNKEKFNSNGVIEKTSDGLENQDNHDNNIPLNISFYEIYNGRIYDLLNYREPLTMREYNGDVILKYLTHCKAENFNEAIDVIKKGMFNRKTGVTGANNESSRSHAIIKIFKVRENKNTENCRSFYGENSIYGNHRLDINDGSEIKSGFNENKVLGIANASFKHTTELVFVDLAGSERGNDRKNVTPATKNEGAEINKSLLALKECIRGIDLKNTYLPFRHSKLTQILKNSFLGNSKTLVIATISGEKNDSEHTLNTLRYAFRIKDGNGVQRAGYKNDIY